MPEYRSVASLRSPAELREYAARLGCEVPVDDQVLTGIDAPLSRPYGLRDGFIVGNRFCAQPMEGWDGTADGKPTELTLRRWRNFGRSGAKLIWGGEAVAVSHEGRANPRQLCPSRENAAELTRLRRALVEAHTAEFGESGDLLVGLQLTHSGRFSRPNRQDLPEPRILCHHPVLDRKLGLPADSPVLTDAEILDVIDRFVEAAEIARDAGFDFVDIKHCHGYLGHEFLSAFDRPGAFGGSLENRTQFLREVVERIRPRVKDLRIGVRVSAFDTVPFGRGPDGRGVPEVCESPYRGFGVNPSDPTQPDLEETGSLLAILGELGVCLVNLTAGSPYYSPHLTRPARYAAPYGYLPPEDPLRGVARQIEVTARLKAGIKRFKGPHGPRDYLAARTFLASLAYEVGFASGEEPAN